ncbi:chromosome partitioning protein [Grimontia hollisae]|uniref:Cobyrinic acid a,c-diamide synthase n=1 Tax=Grimontia hollisae CIP 101886 TaxID=675812 RepID=D0I3H0_GRIHO|nr:AAA family ATPase [Grimontia hollisae]AMG30784.1 chromosome partitioning protein [Grimontia hollisae]EEY73991.1 cobyrinic acid a,c-diamide synthase [Grimontia hollisae CIP 101886]STO47414.1 Sporulation initiation inhibitor protein soj [Grimontia hollisae]
MGKIVALYNNKGGVSKTTTNFNLGAYLSSKGKRVLIVDCDPQCNMTELFFAAREDLDDPDFSLPGTSIYEALLPRFKGQQGEINQQDIQLVEHNLYESMFLFKGDLEFSRAETYFGTAWNQAVTENIHEKNTYIVLNNLLRSLIEAHGFDYVICDVGPSTGAITKTVIITCDEIVVPLVPDRFCYQAVKLLGNVISEWIERHAIISQSLVPFGIEPFAGKPKLAGTILQNFKVHAGARVKESYIKWQNKISHEISTSLCKEGFFEPKNGFDINIPYIASIKDVAVLAPIAQLFGRAIFDIQQEHTKEASSDGRMYYGSVWAPWVNRMDEYKHEISLIAESIS